MNVLQVYPIKAEGGLPPSWCVTQIESLRGKVSEVFLFPVLKRRRFKDLITFGLKLRKRIKENNVDIVHCQWGTSLGFFTVLFSTVPVVISFCGSDLLGNFSINNKKTLRGKISSFLSKVSSLFSNHNIVKSRHLLEALPKLSQKKASIVPNGINSNIFYKRNKLKSRKKIGLSEDKTIVLFVDSKGSWEKNQKLARTIGKELELNKGYQYLEISNVNHNEIPIYFSAVDYLLLTSFHEGSSNVLKEALFCNLKVITTPTGDSKERLKGLEECLISNDITEIVSHIKKYSKKDLVINEEILKKIEVNEIAKKIVSIYKNNIK